VYLGFHDAVATPATTCAVIEELVARRAHDLGITLPVAAI
jgi:hypothetical protein